VSGYTFFDTAIGRCAIAWHERAITAIQLPDARPDATVNRLEALLGPVEEAAPPPFVREIAGRITRHLAGDIQDLTTVVLDDAGLPPFHRAVYRAARRIASGDTCTYGELATAAGSPRAFRAVGQAMKKNPFPIVVPCHRVLGANNTMGGFNAEGGVTTKARMLAIEGVNRQTGHPSRRPR
jgi:methylated-DNA-[protein]-cysteine S-methyltransferase